MKTIFNIIIILGITIVPMMAQQFLRPSIITKSCKEGVKLKILPTNMNQWIEGTKKGYWVERRLKGEKIFHTLNKTPLLPFNKQEWMMFENGKEMYEQQKSAEKEAEKDFSHLSLYNQIASWENTNNGFPFYFLLTTRFADFSKGSGLEYLDDKVKIDQTYEYRIKLVNDSLYSQVSIQKYEGKTIRTVPLNIEVGDKEVNISWIHSDPSPYVSYNLEKSKDGVNFELINEAPIYYNEAVVTDTFYNIGIGKIYRKDSLEVNYKDYYYRLVGIDVWAEKCEPSESVIIQGRDMTAPKPPIYIDVIEDENQTLKILWKCDKEIDLEGFVILHSHQMNENYQVLTKEILGPDTRSYTASNMDDMQNQYFKIAVIDTAGNYAYSRAAYGFVKDKTPPIKPTINKIAVDSFGVIKIFWDSIEDETLKGYMVYTSNSLSTRFNNLTPISIHTTSWTDTVSLHRLNRRRYYKVVAIDNSFNYSPYSEVEMIEIRDTIPPVRCLINKIKTKESAVQLSWNSCVSKDVASYNVERKTERGGWRKIANIKSCKNCFYLDKHPIVGRNIYRISAIDSSKNEGPKSLLREIIIKDKFLTNSNQSISDISAIRKKNVVVLTWNSNKKSNELYRVYRYAEGGKTKLLKMTRKTQIDDANIELGRVYHYYVIGQNKKGKRTGKSSTISLSL